MERPYPEGIDCVWLASDRDGHIGAFITAGAGPIPVDALNSERLDVEDIEERVCSLPRISTARLLVRVKRPESFIAMAERGLFVYDWSDVHRTAREELRGYEPVAVPVNPVSTDGLGDELAASFAGIELKDVAFSDGHVLDIRKHMDCRAVD
jgi:hypothetical protein